MPGSVDDFVMCLLVAYALGTGAQAAAEELALPPLGFFDYLGSMVEHEGELIDPLSLEATTIGKQNAEAGPEARSDDGGGDTADAAEEVQ